MDEVDASVEQLRGPGGDDAEVEGADLARAAAEQLEAEGGSDEALPARHREPHALDPLVRAQMHLLGGVQVAGDRCLAANPGEASAAQHDQDQLDDGVWTVNS